MAMRNSLMGNLLLLCVLAHAGQSRAQENPSFSPPPSIASTFSNETELLRRLLLVRAKTVYLAVRLEPEVREGPETPARREKLALERLDLAVFLETRLKVVKSRKDADLTFLLLVGNAAPDSHVVLKEKLLVLPGGPADGDLRSLWESDWYQGEIADDGPADNAVAEFRGALEYITPEMWIGAQSLSQQPQDDEGPGPPILTDEERRDVLISAKTVAVLSFGPLKRKGTLFESFLVGDAPPWELADATRARADAESVLRKWNRHSLMEDPRNADLLLVITVWNEVADKVGRIHHQKLVSGLKIYRGRTLFGKPQPPLWSGVERAYTGRSTKHVVEHLRKDIEDLMKQSQQKETASPAQLPPKTDP
jgi:hypothetical protein